MRIGEIARRAGTTARALRFYESQGLLSSRRSANGYRDYDEDDLRLVIEIQTLQTVGLSREDTRPFVECLRAGHDTGDACVDSIEVYRRKPAEVDACLARLGPPGAGGQARRRAHPPGRLRRSLRGPDPAEGQAMPNPVTDETFADEVLRHDRPVLVEFWAEWCPPCRMLDPVLAGIERERAGLLTVRKINSDENPATTRDHRVLSLPTMMLFVDGTPVWTGVGARPRARLLAELDDVLDQRSRSRS